MKPGRSLQNLATELTRQLETKKDFIVPTPAMTIQSNAMGESILTAQVPNDRLDFHLTALARRQLAEKLRIPFQYFERMRTEEPALLDQNVNAWLHRAFEEVMLRTGDQKLRAVLSRRYRRIDNYQIADQVIPVLERIPGATFMSVELTETRMYLKVVSRDVEAEIAPGDVVRAGVVISNSEVGCGKLWVQPLVFRLVCANGLIAADQHLAKTHLGRLLEASEETFIVFKDDTLKAQDDALLLAVRDAVEAAVSQSTLSLLSQKLRATMGIRIAGDPAVAIEHLADRYALSENEQSGVLRHLVNGGMLTGYGLVNAVTEFSQTVGDYDRATELEMLGGKLIELPQGEWQRLAAAT